MATQVALPRAEAPELERFRPRAGWFRGVRNFITRKPLGALGAFIILVMVSAAVITFLGFTDDLTGYRYDDQVLADRFQGPSRDHLLGTDFVGRDTLSRIIYGSRVSITIGFLAVAITQGVALVIGIVSGYYGGKVDAFMQRLVDIGQAMPGLVALLFVISVFGSSEAVLIATIGLLGAWGSSRVIRGTVITVRQNQYVEAAVMLGASDRRILMRHILPNIVHIVLITASVGIGAAILVESTLAFLGFGLPPPFPTWGRMLNNSREYVTHPWLAIWPGLALTLTVFAFNIVGDALRDIWDPRLRGSR